MFIFRTIVALLLLAIALHVLAIQPATTGPPSNRPSSTPTGQPHRTPTTQPTMQPSSIPTAQPSAQRSNSPSAQPTSIPSLPPTSLPTMPTSQPSSPPSVNPSCAPSNQPTMQPWASPSLNPNALPTRQPSCQPSSIPSTTPSTQPTNCPTMPTSQPSLQPSSQPIMLPTSQPTVFPTDEPTHQPFAMPSSAPSYQPTSFPSQPTSQPSNYPTSQPINKPSSEPSIQPSITPSSAPTITPSRNPSIQPSCRPSSKPSIQPSAQPTSDPTKQPWSVPTMQPQSVPTSSPSQQPYGVPTNIPTRQPSRLPSCQPSRQPSRRPTSQPLSFPSAYPSAQPISIPTLQPFTRPSRVPTGQPSRQPTSIPSRQPSIKPSHQPSGQPTSCPSVQPTVQPMQKPTAQPSTYPSCQPTSQPTSQPSLQPTVEPSMQPTSQPSLRPSCFPTQQPADTPTHQPTSAPSKQPTIQPTSQPSNQPTSQPTLQPSGQPTTQPTTEPSIQPTNQPSTAPSIQPSQRPSTQPSIQPSGTPSMQPSVQPTRQPTMQPSNVPSKQPSSQPSIQPSTQPSRIPSSQPSMQPSKLPTGQPTRIPTAQPSRQPSSCPTKQPSRQPSIQPSTQPTTQPSNRPSRQPSSQPSIVPSSQPSGQPTIRPSTSRPSSSPTGAPSKFPTTSRPTKPGETNYPSSVPTGRPTVTTEYKHLAAYQYFDYHKTRLLAIPNSLTFGSFSLNGHVTNGTCDSWQSFTQSSISFEFDDIYISQIDAFYEYYSFSDKSTRQYNATCSDADVIPPLLRSLKTGVEFEGNCGGNTWNVFTCSSVRIFCVNCKRLCNVNEICPGTSYVVNPCISECAKHAAAAVVLNFQYTVVNLHPTFVVPFTVSSVPWSTAETLPGSETTSAQLEVNITLSKAGVVYCAAFIITSRRTAVTSIDQIQRMPGVSSVFVHEPFRSTTLNIAGLYADTEYTVMCATDDTLSHTMPIDEVVKYIVSPVKTRIGTRRLVLLRSLDIIPQYTSALAEPLTEPVFTVGISSPPMVNSSVLVSIRLEQVNCVTRVPVVDIDTDNSQCIPGTSGCVPQATATAAYPSSFLFPAYNFSADTDVDLPYPEEFMLSRDFRVRGGITGCYEMYVDSEIILHPSALKYAAVQNKSTAASAYVQYESTNQSLIIRNAYTVPDAPEISTAFLSANGNQIKLQFNAATDRGETIIKSPAAKLSLEAALIFDCTLLLDFSLASTSICYWSSTSEITIDLNAGISSVVDGNTDTISVGFDAAGSVLGSISSISLIDNAVKGACPDFLDCSGAAYVQAVTVPVKFAVISDISRISPSSCISAIPRVQFGDDIQLDISCSSGNTARPWRNISWYVTGVANSRWLTASLEDISTSTDAMVDYLNSNYVFETEAIISIPSRYTVEWVTYSISLTLTNALLKSSTATVAVYLSGFESRVSKLDLGYDLTPQVPRVRIYNPYGVTSNTPVYSSQQLILFADAYFSSDAVNVSSQPIEYSWGIYEGSLYIPSLKSTSKDSRYFKLPKFSLRPDTRYKVVVTASIPAIEGVNVLSSTATAVVYVQPQGVVPIVSGGSHQTWSISKENMLDASFSYDLDEYEYSDDEINPFDAQTSSPYYDYDSNVVNLVSPVYDSHLAFKWSCTMMSPNYDADCGIAGVAFPIMGPKVHFPVKSLLSDSILEFTLTVWNEFGLSSTSTVTIYTVKNVNIPRISVVTQYRPKHNIGEKVIISALVNSSKDSFGQQPAKMMTTEWTCAQLPYLGRSTDTALNGGIVPLTPLTSTFTIGEFFLQMSLSSVNLIPRIPYTFKLTVLQLHANGTAMRPAQSAIGGVTIVFNGGPTAGFFKVNPKSGNALSTVFYSQTSNWMDDAGDYPLQYSFSYYVLVETTDVMIVRNFDPVPYCKAILGPGLKSRGYEVTYVVVVQDRWGAASNMSLPVIVSSESVSKTVIESQFNAQYSSSLLLSDSSFAVATISAASALNNLVDCAVLVECSTLNRYACSQTHTTCGPCLPGYIGVAGDANLWCDSRESLASTSLVPNSSFKSSFADLDAHNLRLTAESIGLPCLGNSSCVTGYCSSATMTCVDSLKKCPGDCDGPVKGVCEFIDSNGLPLNECMWSDSRCFARCRCYSGHFGRDCSVGEKDQQKGAALRLQLCQSLNSSALLVLDEDLSPSILKSMYSTIYSLLLDSTQVQSAAVDSCFQAWQHATAYALNRMCVDGATTGLFQAALESLDRVVGLVDVLSTSKVHQIDSALVELVSAYQRCTVIGEASSATFTEFFVISTQVSEPQSVLNSTLVVPQTDIQRYMQIAPSSVLFENAGAVGPTNTNTSYTSLAQSSSVVGLSFVQFHLNTHRNPSNISSVRVVIDQYDSVPTIPQLLKLMASSSTSSLYMDASSAAISFTQLVIQNEESVAYPSRSATKTTVECLQTSAEPYTKNVTCPTGSAGVPFSTIEVTCPGDGIKGLFTITCPGFVTRPQCVLYNPSTASFDAAPQCTVAEYSSNYTICACEQHNGVIGETGHSLGLVASVESMYLVSSDYEYSITLITDIEDVITDFSKAPLAITAEFNNVVLSTLQWITIVLFAGLLFTTCFGSCTYVLSDLPIIKNNQLRLLDCTGIAPQSENEFGDEFLEQLREEGTVGMNPHEEYILYMKQWRRAQSSRLPNRRRAHDFFESILPNEFRAGHWTGLLYIRMCLDHVWFKAAHIEELVQVCYRWMFPIAATLQRQEREHQFTLSQMPILQADVGRSPHRRHMFQHPFKKTLVWLQAGIKFIAIIFFTSFCVHTWFADDGSCEAIDLKSECETRRSHFALPFYSFEICTWNQENTSCEFKPLSVTFMNEIIFIVLILLPVHVTFAALKILVDEVDKSLAVYFFDCSVNNISMERLRHKSSKRTRQTAPVLREMFAIGSNSDYNGGCFKSKQHMSTQEENPSRVIGSNFTEDGKQLSLNKQHGRSAVFTLYDGKLLSRALAAHRHRRRVDSSGKWKALSPRALCIDEFNINCHVSSILWHGARLERCRMLMDRCTPIQEANNVIANGKVDKLRAQARKMSFHIDHTSFAHVRYGFSSYEPSPKRVLKRIEQVRVAADALLSEVDSGNMTPIEIEELLMKHFLVDIFSGHEQVIARKYIFRDRGVSIASLWWPYCATAGPMVALKTGILLSLTVAATLTMLYIIYILSATSRIGSLSTDQWLLLLVLCFLFDAFIVQPFRLWFSWVFVVGLGAGRQVRHLCDQLCSRTRLSMMRSSGSIRTADCMLQHFNPAARAARSERVNGGPGSKGVVLPVARFLTTLNDFDIILPDDDRVEYYKDIRTNQLKQRYRWNYLLRKIWSEWVYHHVMVVASPCLSLLWMLPDPLHELLLDILCTVTAATVATCFYLLATVSYHGTVIACSLTGALLLTVLIRQLVRYVTHSRLRHRREEDENIGAFTEVDELDSMSVLCRSTRRYKPLQSAAPITLVPHGSDALSHNKFRGAYNNEGEQTGDDLDYNDGVLLDFVSENKVDEHFVLPQKILAPANEQNNAKIDENDEIHTDAVRHSMEAKNMHGKVNVVVDGSHAAELGPTLLVHKSGREFTNTAVVATLFKSSGTSVMVSEDGSNEKRADYESKRSVTGPPMSSECSYLNRHLYWDPTTTSLAIAASNDAGVRLDISQSASAMALHESKSSFILPTRPFTTGKVVAANLLKRQAEPISMVRSGVAPIAGMEADTVHFAFHKQYTVDEVHGVVAEDLPREQLRLYSNTETGIDATTTVGRRALNARAESSEITTTTAKDEVIAPYSLSMHLNMKSHQERENKLQGLQQQSQPALIRRLTSALIPPALAAEKQEKQQQMSAKERHYKAVMRQSYSKSAHQRATRQSEFPGEDNEDNSGMCGEQSNIVGSPGSAQRRRRSHRRSRGPIIGESGEREAAARSTQWELSTKGKNNQHGVIGKHATDHQRQTAVSNSREYIPNAPENLQEKVRHALSRRSKSGFVQDQGGIAASQHKPQSQTPLGHSSERSDMGPGGKQDTRALVFERELVVASLQQLQQWEDSNGANVNGNSSTFRVQKTTAFPQVHFLGGNNNSFMPSATDTVTGRAGAAAAAHRGGSEFIRACVDENESFYFEPGTGSIWNDSSECGLLDEHYDSRSIHHSHQSHQDRRVLSQQSEQGPGSAVTRTASVSQTNSKFPMYI